MHLEHRIKQCCPQAATAELVSYNSGGVQSIPQWPEMVHWVFVKGAGMWEQAPARTVATES